MTFSTKKSYVPDSSPGPVTVRGASGRTVVEPSSVARACALDQLSKPVDSGPMRAYRSAKVRHVRAVLAAEVMTDRPSRATLSSTYSTPLAAHLSASPSGLMARDASEMSVSPSQNRAKPSPVPGPSTVMATPGEAALNASWMAVVMGWTVDEPEMVMEPVRPAGAAGIARRAAGDWATAAPPVAMVAMRMRLPAASAGRRVVWDIAGWSSCGGPDAGVASALTSCGCPQRRAAP